MRSVNYKKKRGPAYSAASSEVTWTSRGLVWGTTARRGDEKWSNLCHPAPPLSAAAPRRGCGGWRRGGPPPSRDGRPPTRATCPPLGAGTRGGGGSVNVGVRVPAGRIRIGDHMSSSAQLGNPSLGEKNVGDQKKIMETRHPSGEHYMSERSESPFSLSQIRRPAHLGSVSK